VRMNSALTRSNWSWYQNDVSDDTVCTIRKTRRDRLREIRGGSAMCKGCLFFGDMATCMVKGSTRAKRSDVYVYLVLAFNNMN
jgi:hypothetical protein